MSLSNVIAQCFIEYTSSLAGGKLTYLRDDYYKDIYIPNCDAIASTVFTKITIYLKVFIFDFLGNRWINVFFIILHTLYIQIKIYAFT